MMQHKNQSTNANSSLATSFDFYEIMRARGDVFQRLGNELEINKQLVSQLMNFSVNQRTASVSQGSNASGGFHGSHQKYQSSQSGIFVKNEQEEAEESEEDEEANSSSKQIPQKQKNDTKNIPKNYGKAILSFIQKSPLSRKLASQMGITYPDLMINVRRLKKRVNSIDTLKKMWGSEDLNHKIKKCIRVLSYHFMRKHCFKYIFHSKIRHVGTHIKYRTKLIQGIENPTIFNCIKDY